MTLGKKLPDHMRADELGAADDQNTHVKIDATASRHRLLSFNGAVTSDLDGRFKSHFADYSLSRTSPADRSSMKNVNRAACAVTEKGGSPHATSTLP